jgi:hypothetical protein
VGVYVRMYITILFNCILMALYITDTYVHVHTSRSIHYTYLLHWTTADYRIPDCMILRIVINTSHMRRSNARQDAIHVARIRFIAYIGICYSETIDPQFGSMVEPLVVDSPK